MPTEFSGNKEPHQEIPEDGKPHQEEDPFDLNVLRQHLNDIGMAGGDSGKGTTGTGSSAFDTMLEHFKQIKMAEGDSAGNDQTASVKQGLDKKEVNKILREVIPGDIRMGRGSKPKDRSKPVHKITKKTTEQRRSQISSDRGASRQTLAPPQFQELPTSGLFPKSFSKEGAEAVGCRLDISEPVSPKSLPAQFPDSFSKEGVETSEAVPTQGQPGISGQEVPNITISLSEEEMDIDK